MAGPRTPTIGTAAMIDYNIKLNLNCKAGTLIYIYIWFSVMLTTCHYKYNDKCEDMHHAKL